MLVSRKGIIALTFTETSSMNWARERQIERLTTNYDFDFKVGLADPIHCAAQLL